MPDCIPNTLMLNGVLYNEIALRNLIADVNKGISNSLMEKLVAFLNDWLDETPYIMLRTSGSTGPPKTIQIEKIRMINSAGMTGRFFGLKPEMKALLCLSPEFIAGKMMVARALVLGLDLLTTSLEANPLKDLNQTVDFAAMVPLQVAHVLKQNPEKFSLIKTLIVGGGPIPATVEEDLQSVPTFCWHSYGMTETLSHVALRAVNGLHRSNWFAPMEGVGLSTDDRGCLVLSAPAVATGPVATNDLVELKGQQFKVLGRIDDVVISAGQKFHPAQLEQKLSRVIQTPFFLTGEYHPEAGQILALYLEGNFKNEEILKLKKQIESLLQKNETPRKVVCISKFKYLESGKIDRLRTIAGNIYS